MIYFCIMNKSFKQQNIRCKSTLFPQKIKYCITDGQ